MTRTRKVLIAAGIVVGVIGAVAIAAYGVYVVVIVALLHAAFNPTCPPSYEKLTNACAALARKDPAVHCQTSRAGPTPSGPQGICEAFNRVNLDWEPDPAAGWQASTDSSTSRATHRTARARGRANRAA